MAAIYDAYTAETITEVLQSRTVCDEAIQAALSLARDLGKSVVLDDDGELQTIHPDGSIEDGADGFESDA